MEKFYRHFATLNSTNQWAKENVALLSKEGLTIVSAQEQLAGYGQKKKAWLAPRGEGLWATFCLYGGDGDGFVMTRHMAATLVEWLHLQQVEGKVKWPNDVLVNGKKIAGILTEVVENFFLIGVGMNTNMPQSTLDQIDQPATSLLVKTGLHFQTEALMVTLADLFLFRISSDATCPRLSTGVQ